MAEKTNLHPAIHKVRFERTFCMVKPDGVMRGLVGEIISRLERAGLKVVAMKMLIPSKEQATAHYPTSDEAWVRRLGQKTHTGFAEIKGVSVKEVLGTDDELELGKGVVAGLVDFLCSGPVVCMVVEGIQAVDMVRKLAGHTLPFKADVGTIRGDYSVDSPLIANTQQRPMHNLFHASENAAEAAHEINLWFGGEPIYDYKFGDEALMYAKYY